MLFLKRFAPREYLPIAMTESGRTLASVTKAEMAYGVFAELVMMVYEAALRASAASNHDFEKSSRGCRCSVVRVAA